MNLEDVDRWVIGGPAAHPMKDVADYFRCADVVAQASLAEGLGFSPLEALAWRRRSSPPQSAAWQWSLSAGHDWYRGAVVVSHG